MLLYQLYNLALKSEIEFPELIPFEPPSASGEVVELRMGSVPPRSLTSLLRGFSTNSTAISVFTICPASLDSS